MLHNISRLFQFFLFYHNLGHKILHTLLQFIPALINTTYYSMYLYHAHCNTDVCLFMSPISNYHFPISHISVNTRVRLFERQLPTTLFPQDIVARLLVCSIYRKIENLLAVICSDIHLFLIYTNRQNALLNVLLTFTVSMRDC